MKTPTIALALVAALSSGACASTMNVTTTPPGADITVDGKPMGKSPATVKVDGGNAPVAVKAKYQGKEVVKNVPRDQIDWATIGAGAGAGVGGCCALSAVAFGVNLVVPFAGIPISCLACGSLVGGPLGAYFLWGQKPAEQVTLDLGVPAAPAEAPPAGPVPPPPDAPPAPEPLAPATPY